MTAQPFGISWSNFTSGINDQKYQGVSGRYFAGYGVDTQRYDVRPQESSRLVETYEDGINAIFCTDRITTNLNNIVWLNNGKIYQNSTLRATIAGTAKQGYNIGYMRPNGSTESKLYYFHFTGPSNPIKYIHRSNIDVTGFEENYRQYTSDSGNAFLIPPGQPSPMIVISEGNRILFSYYNEVWEISSSEILTKKISFPSEQNVVGITEFQGQYKIYTTAGESTSRIYKWDGQNGIPDLSIDLRGLAITGGVANLGAFDYIIADGSFYEVAGVQYNKLYNKINGRIVASYDDKVILELGYGEKSFLAEYGSEPGYSKGIHPKYIINIANQGVGVSAIDYNKSGLVFGNDRKLFNNYQSATTGNVTAFMESLVFVGDSIQYEKTASEIVLKISGFSTNVILYAQIQENGTWVKLFEGNNSTISTQNHGFKIPSTAFLNPLGNFNTIRFKVEFPHTGTTSGRFYGIDLFGNQNIGK